MITDDLDISLLNANWDLLYAIITTSDILVIANIPSISWPA